MPSASSRGRGRHRHADRRLRDRAGHHTQGLFSPDDALAAELLAAGQEALDPAWRMPLDDEYDEALKSNFADMANIGGPPGGAITAAMFLQALHRLSRAG
jgi:leucyl aminopeptidase